jgi:hypothetical protein
MVMNLRLVAGLAGVASLALASAAAAQPPPGCFFVRDVGDTTVTGPHTLYFKVKDVSHMHALAYYHVETRSACGTGEVGHGSFLVSSHVFSAKRDQMICSVNDVVITDGVPCPIASIEKMTPQEVAALPRRLRP